MTTKTLRRNGVRVKVTRWPHGVTVVEATCGCHGLSGRVHSTEFCPNRKRQMAEAADRALTSKESRS